MHSQRDQVVSLLGQGYSQTTVASALGVTPSWVSQIADEDREKVATLRVGKLQERVADDTNLDDLERRALKLVADKLPFVRSPMEATRIYATLNAAKRKTANNTPDTDSASVETVTITLPRAAAAIHIQLNAKNQVISVEGQTMAPMPSRAIPGLQAMLPVQQIEDLQVLQLPPSREDPRAAITARLQKQDAVTAALRIRDLEVVIDGVTCVL